MRYDYGAIAGAESDENWDDTVFLYCLSLGLQFGFQTFTSPLKKGTAKQEWYPSTVSLASANLTALLRDVSSRCSIAGAPDNPARCAGLACAVRDLHNMIFQQYATWLKAAGLRPAARPCDAPTMESLHEELADLALYWLVYTEAANLRHTPEMIWFIFFCAQRSWQAKQVRDHIQTHQHVFQDLLQQPWLEKLGPGLVRAVQTLHERYRTAQSEVRRVDPGVGNLGRSGNGGKDRQGVRTEATFARISVQSQELLRGDGGPHIQDVDLPSDPTNAKAENALARDTNKLRINVLAEGSSITFASAMPPLASASTSAGSVVNAAAVTKVTTSTSLGGSTSSTYPTESVTMSASAADKPAPQRTAEPLAGLQSANTLNSNRQDVELSPLGTNGTISRPSDWDPRVPIAGYRELLLRICPNRAAVDAALAAGVPADGGNSGVSMRFLERVVQPLFLFLTEQVYELGQARRQGLEAAVRIGYDDVSESMAHPGVVAAALAALPATDHKDVVRLNETCDERVCVSQPELRMESQTHQGGSAAHFEPNNEQWYWSRLLRLSDGKPLSESTRIPWQGDMEHYRPQLLQLLQIDGAIGSFNNTPDVPAGAAKPSCWGRCLDGSKAGSVDDVEAAHSSAARGFSSHQSLKPEAMSEVGCLRRANVAADWWAQRVLRKTFAEHRSLAMPLLAFKRVFQFHLCWFYLMCVLSWSESNSRWAWIASTAALHWGTNCLLWSMQVILSFKPRIERNNVVVPSYGTKEAERVLGNEPRAPYGLYSTAYHLSHVVWISITWTTFIVGVYVIYTVVPNSSSCGHQGQNCYRGIFAAYTAGLFAYELLYRQFNFGGYARRQLYQLVMGLVPQGTASASSSSNPLYDPAKHLRTGLNYLLGNGLLWAATLGLKFIIDFYILVRPAGPQLREIMMTDSLPSSYHVGHRRYYVDLDPFMAGAQVIVLFLLSLVSTGVSYTVATALWGAMQGVVQGIGSIRHWRHIRAGFHRIQEAMRAKLLLTKEKSVKDTRPWAIRVVSRYLNVLKLLGASLKRMARRLRGLPSAPAPDRPKRWEARERMMAVTAPFWNSIVRSMRDRDLLSDREAMALSFTAVSFTPSSVLGTMARGHHRRADQRMTYLPPMAVHVAQIHQLVITGSAPSAEQLDVIQEAYLCLLHLLVAVGAVAHSPDDLSGSAAAGYQVPAAGAIDGPGTEPVASATSPPGLDKRSLHPDEFSGTSLWTWSYTRLAQRKELLGKVVELVSALVEAGKVFHKTRTQQEDASRKDAIAKLSKTLHALARCMSQTRDLPNSIIRTMKAVVDAQHFKDPGVTTQLQEGFSMMVDQHHSLRRCIDYNDFVKVSTWLLAILRSNDEGTAPSNQEAVSLLADFCSGLMHPRLPTAPRVDSMRSVSTLIPHYQETVLYALSSCDARTALEQAGAKNLQGTLADDDVLFIKDGEDFKLSPLLQYLLSTFPDEFRNLLERCRTLYPLASGEPAYVLTDFLPGGRLYDGRAQLLLWASCRGQVLARTVDGMCMYRTALALQAVHDALQSNPAADTVMEHAGENSRHTEAQPGSQTGTDSTVEGSQQQLKLSANTTEQIHAILLKEDIRSVEELIAELVERVPGLGALLDRKYGLVVASQVFSKMAASRNLADRWRAHGIKLLATRYSAMRVAYLEQDGDQITLFDAPDFQYSVVHQASVLVRAAPLEIEVAAALRAAAEGKPTAELTPGFLLVPGEDANSTNIRPGNHGAGAGSGLSRVSEKEQIALQIWQRRFLLDKLEAVEMEVLFRLQLPVNYYDRNAAGVGVILGEGKPENQNSAVPYCPGVLLQTIDMNQDNSLAQAFKLRNVTREFEPLGPGREDQQVAVLGYAEWIFSYRCGLLADLAAATERTFGTQFQRVMAFPSAVRANYGHPDFWHRPFTMTRGGVSKANAVQHVSEDVFGGYNALKRGGLSKYVSYISVGKGRDMGLDSILGFEGKISKGCAEQLMSRDLRFLGFNTDFFRSMSLYITVPGHFINTWLTVVTIQLGIWVQLLLLLGGVSKTGSRVASAIGAIQILQLGTMPLLGFLFNMWLESGMGVAVATLARHFIGGGLLFHIVRSVTSAFHLGRAVLFGGASYVATGRGFSLRRRTFTQVYCNYGRSHMYLGADILLMVILILVVGNNGGNIMPIPAAALWSPILVAVALLAGPFWFTPFFFRLQPVLRDTREFRSWVAGSSARGVAESWPEWNNGQLSAMRDDAGTQVPRYRFWSTSAIVVPRAATCILSAIAAVSSAHFESDLPDLVWVFGGSAVAWCLLGAAAACRKTYLTSGLSIAWRWAKGMVMVAILAALALLAAACLFMKKRGLRFSSFLITLYANYSVASLVLAVLVVWMPKSMLARSMANSLYKRVDAVLGVALAIVLIIICFIGEIGLIMVDKVQTLVQFNDRYIHSQAAQSYAGADDMPSTSKLRRRKAPSESTRLLTATGSTVADGDAHGRPGSAGGAQQQAAGVAGGCRHSTAEDANPNFWSFPVTPDWYSPRTQDAFRARRELPLASVVPLTPCSSDTGGAFAPPGSTPPAGTGAAALRMADQTPEVGAAAEEAPPPLPLSYQPPAIMEAAQPAAEQPPARSLLDLATQVGPATHHAQAEAVSAPQPSPASL